MLVNRKISKVMMFTVLSGALLVSGCSGSGTNTATDSPKPTDKGVVNSKEAVYLAAADTSKIPAAAKNRKDTFVAGTTKPGGVFNPYFYHNGWDGNVTDVIFAPLVGNDKTGKPFPVLAEKWDISSDQLNYTFHLRSGLKFSDGTPITAEDVAFTLTVLHDPTYDGETDIKLAHIKGGQAYKEGKADAIEGIKVINSQTIEIDTDQVSAQSLPLLGGSVLSKAYYGKEFARGHLEYIRSMFSKPMGAGPYKLDQYMTGQELRFTANPNFYTGKPVTEHFIYKITTSDTNFQLFQTGDTDSDRFDANPDNFEQLKSLGYADINMYTASLYGSIAFNNKKPYFQDKRIKQAFFYGLDRQKIVDSFFQGYGSVADEPTSPVSWAYAQNVKSYNYDLDKAKQLLDETGWKVGADGIREKDGQKLKISFIGSKTRAINSTIISIATENYKALGIGFDAQLFDVNTLLDKMKKGDFDLAFSESNIITDPHDNAQNYLSGSPANVSGYSNPKADQLINEGLKNVDIEKRKAIYSELFKVLTEDPPVIYVYYRKTMQGTNARMKGLEPDPFTGIINTLPKVKIEQ